MAVFKGCNRLFADRIVDNLMDNPCRSVRWEEDDLDYECTSTAENIRAAG